MAVRTCCAVGCLYVGCLYLASGGAQSRDSPSVILRRSAAAVAACALSWLPVAHTFPNESFESTAARLGLSLQRSGAGVCWAFLLLLLLYAGPLLYTSTPRRPRLSREQWLRNLVVAPCCEEFTFRGVLVALLLSDRGDASTAGSQPLRRIDVIFLCPLFFGVAHVHHLWELCVVCGRPLSQALAAVTFQMAYTAAFGALATALLLQTGTLAAPVTAHILCNAYGVPPLHTIWAHSLQARLVLLLGILAFAASLRVLLLQPVTLPGF